MSQTTDDQFPFGARKGRPKHSVHCQIHDHPALECNCGISKHLAMLDREKVRTLMGRLK